SGRAPSMARWGPAPPAAAGRPVQCSSTRDGIGQDQAPRQVRDEAERPTAGRAPVHRRLRATPERLPRERRDKGLCGFGRSDGARAGRKPCSRSCARSYVMARYPLLVQFEFHPGSSDAAATAEYLDSVLNADPSVPGLQVPTVFTPDDGSGEPPEAHLATE